MSRRVLYLIFSIYFLAVFALVTFPPLLAIIDTIEPHILGLPCAQFFILFSSIMTVLGLMAFYLIEYRIEDKRYEKEQAEIAKEVEASE